MESYIMSIDQGTTSSRAIIFDKTGKEFSSSQKEFTQYFPKPGWVEHNPNEIWNSVQSVIAGALIEGGIRPNQIEASVLQTNEKPRLFGKKRRDDRFTMPLSGNPNKPVTLPTI